MLQPLVVCEVCGHRQLMRRVTRRPVTFRLICHECEAELCVVVTAADIANAEAPVRLGRKVAP